MKLVIYVSYKWDGSEDAYLVSEEGYQDAGFLSIVEDLLLIFHHKSNVCFVIIEKTQDRLALKVYS